VGHWVLHRQLPYSSLSVTAMMKLFKLAITAN
jgi:hypothetical protein